jgi:hypothetical protein
MSDNFCPFLSSGLVYNNDRTEFNMAPCCYFRRVDRVQPHQTVDWHNLRTQWADPEHRAYRCGICLDQESSGIPSYRQAAHDVITNPGKLQMLTVAVNKQCNLACATCSAGLSSFWYQENRRNGVKQSDGIHLLHQEDRDGTTQQRFVQQLLDLDLTELTYIKFGGGEPLMNDTHVRILELVPRPERVTLQYTSNFSIAPSREALELWRQFHLVKWMASIDGCGDHFNILRWPYTWHKLQLFVNRARTITPDNVMFGVEHTLNPLNIYYFDRFQEWFAVWFGYDAVNVPTDLNLHAAEGIMGLDRTPEPLRQAVTQRYGEHHPVSRLLNQQPQHHDIKNFVTWMDTLDQWRGHHWRQAFAEVEQYFRV